MPPALATVTPCDKYTEGLGSISRNVPVYLFVCDQNYLRSPFCAEYFESLLKRVGMYGTVTSAGLRASDEKVPLLDGGHWRKRRLNRQMIDSSRKIFTMTPKMVREIKDKYGEEEKVVCLNIFSYEDRPEILSPQDIVFDRTSHSDFGLKIKTRLNELLLELLPTDPYMITRH